MSNPTFVLTVDASTARVFQVDGESPRGLPSLTEVSSLVRPEARLPESQRYSDSMPRSTIGGGGYHTFDDHRHDHDVEERRRFAKHIAVTLADLVHAPSRVVVCVTHSMQSLLADDVVRERLEVVLGQQLAGKEVRSLQTVGLALAAAFLLARTGSGG